MRWAAFFALAVPLAAVHTVARVLALGLEWVADITAAAAIALLWKARG